VVLVKVRQCFAAFHFHDLGRQRQSHALVLMLDADFQNGIEVRHDFFQVRPGVAVVAAEAARVHVEIADGHDAPDLDATQGGNVAVDRIIEIDQSLIDHLKKEDGA
jgi:hypothetical protein